jgi:hypothetical protein
VLPRADNPVTLHASKGDAGLPLVHIDCTFGENERSSPRRPTRTRRQCSWPRGCTNVRALFPHLRRRAERPRNGYRRMGLDPATSVLNRHNRRTHVPNLFITDGSHGLPGDAPTHR